MCHLEIAYRGVLIRFADGSSVTFQKNAYDQLVEGEYSIVGWKPHDDVLEMRRSAQLEVLARGYQVVH